MTKEKAGETHPAWPMGVECKQSQAQETNTPAPHPSKMQVASGAACQDECLEELPGKPRAYFVWKPDAV